MPTYNLTLILGAKTVAASIQNSLGRISRIVCPSGGLIHKVDNIGLRPLSDKMSRHGKSHHEARYLQATVEARPEVISGVTNYLRGDETVIRWQFRKTRPYQLKMLKPRTRNKIAERLYGKKDSPEPTPLYDLPFGHELDELQLDKNEIAQLDKNAKKSKSLIEKSNKRQEILDPQLRKEIRRLDRLFYIEQHGEIKKLSELGKKTSENTIQSKDQPEFKSSEDKSEDSNENSHRKDPALTSPQYVHSEIPKEAISIDVAEKIEGKFKYEPKQDNFFEYTEYEDVKPDVLDPIDSRKVKDLESRMYHLREQMREKKKSVEIISDSDETINSEDKPIDFADDKENEYESEDLPYNLKTVFLKSKRGIQEIKNQELKDIMREQMPTSSEYVSESTQESLYTEQEEQLNSKDEEQEEYLNSAENEQEEYLNSAENEQEEYLNSDDNEQGEQLNSNDNEQGEQLNWGEEPEEPNSNHTDGQKEVEAFMQGKGIGTKLETDDFDSDKEREKDFKSFVKEVQNDFLGKNSKSGQSDDYWENSSSEVESSSSSAKQKTKEKDSSPEDYLNITENLKYRYPAFSRKMELALDLADPKKKREAQKKDVDHILDTMKQNPDFDDEDDILEKFRNELDPKNKGGIDLDEALKKFTGKEQNQDYDEMDEEYDKRIHKDTKRRK